MTEKDFIQFCRYYKGEKECKNKDIDVQTLFKIEKTWVERSVEEDTAFFKNLLLDYIRAGLQEFEQADDTPLTLKTLLFNRFTQYNDRVDTPAFKRWYKKFYPN